MSALDDREERRRARAQWPISRYRLGAEPGEDLSDSTTPSERLAMMWPLAREAWLFAGRKLPDYTRENLPGRICRPGQPRPDDDD